MTAQKVTTEDLRTAVTEGMRRQIVFATTDILFFFLWNISINYICKKKSVYSSDETQSTKQVYNQNSRLSGFSETQQEFFPHDCEISL